MAQTVSSSTAASGGSEEEGGRRQSPPKPPDAAAAVGEQAAPMEGKWAQVNVCVRERCCAFVCSHIMIWMP